MAVDIQKAKDEFSMIYDRIERDGAMALYDWMENETDFFVAPASSKYHLCEPGGLCQHSINVYNRLKMFLDCEYGKNNPYSEETIAIVSLLHDLCKTGFYEMDWKNQKNYDSEVVRNAPPKERKSDNRGEFIWESVPTYTIREQFIYGHGEKSVYLVRNYMNLTDEEAQAIRFHMGSFTEADKNNVGKVYAQSPLAFYLNMADGAATFLDEPRGE